MKPCGWAITDVGRRRDHNEDTFLCNNRLALYAVADGMGGHLGGERASHMAVEILEREMERSLDGELKATVSGPKPEGGLRAVAQALRDATIVAAKTIHEAAHTDAQHAGMGTTLTSALFHGKHVSVCHVGDSRAYLYRDGRARQLTEDHSWIQEQVRAGLLSREDALLSRFRNIITRSVGFEPTVEPDLLTLPVELGDCFLLCSDGLSNYLSTEEIAQVLTDRFYADAGPAFVEIANERGGEDNITCIVIYVANVGENPET